MLIDLEEYQKEKDDEVELEWAYFWVGSISRCNIQPMFLEFKDRVPITTIT